MDQTELFQRLSRLYSAALSDALDALGFRHQAMAHTIVPMFPGAKVIGRARTVLSVPKPGFPSKPYEKELEMLDTVGPGDALVFCTTDDFGSGVWGGLMSTAARAKGGTGAVIDGLTRDLGAITDLRFPVFARGVSPCDAHGRSEVIAYDVPIHCGGVLVNPGDIVFADSDGLLAIPSQCAEAALEAAETKVARETIVEDEFRKGRKVAEVFAEYGIL